MDLKMLDSVGKQLVAIELEVQVAKSDLREVEARKAAAAKEIVQLDGKQETLRAQLRKVTQRRKVALGLAFYDVLEMNGLSKALASVTTADAEHPALLRHALSQVSTGSDETVAAKVVAAVVKYSRPLQKPPG